MFAGFERYDLETPRGTVCARVGGAGPPLLLLHGYPQTGLMWRDVGPALARQFTVVAADLPGYGDSFRPEPTEDHCAHSKRAMAADLVAAMSALGHARFGVAGHDRGGRVAYRMALDHPDRVQRLAVLDIVPTAEVWRRIDRTSAYLYWHWPFLAQPAPLPERMILAAADEFLDEHVRRIGLGVAPGRYPEEVMAVYRGQLRDPPTVQAICEDYRAGASIDVDHDEAGGTIGCPVLALWAARGALPIFYGDVLDVWRPWAPDVRGHAIEASHFLIEDEPEQVAAELGEFFGG
ncbi:MAG: haloacetate dehalogenase [Solirubrobacteraceae bacterium]|jgi:haloacetate dehalogenase|nr:haloacetate dehalogenase [Solirubrobacteraceae bacterium]